MPKPESRIGLDAGSGSGMTFDMFNCRSNNMFSCVRISSVSGFLFDEIELPESADLDLLAIFKGLLYYLQDGFYYVFGFVLRKAKLVLD